MQLPYVLLWKTYNWLVSPSVYEHMEHYIYLILLDRKQLRNNNSFTTDMNAIM